MNSVLKKWFKSLQTELISWIIGSVWRKRTNFPEYCFIFEKPGLARPLLGNHLAIDDFGSGCDACRAECLIHDQTGIVR